MNIYVACALTQVPRELFSAYAEFIHLLAGAIRSDAAGHVVKYALVDSDPQLAEKPELERARLCYLWDRKMVESADLLVAECSFPSTGLGIELQIAETYDIPIVLCYRDFAINRARPVSYENPDHTHHQLQIGDGLVSLMALGIPAIFKRVQYLDETDGIRQVMVAVSAFARRAVIPGGTATNA